MRCVLSRFALPLLVASALASPARARPAYPWLVGDAARERLEERFAPPEGFTRVNVEEGSFGAWLRGLPLLPKGAKVRAYDGRELDAQAAAVVELDVGERDLQQCADSIIRLRAEYLFATSQQGRVAFHFTNGHLAPFSRWAKGERPRVGKDNRVRWDKRHKPDASHASLRAYLDAVYMWAGSASLAAYTPKAKRDALAPGDFFVLGGFPGHAVLVLDVATAKDGRKKVLLGQGFMPAQSFHVIARDDGEAWFDLDPKAEGVEVPSWREPFPWASLRRFADAPTAR